MRVLVCGGRDYDDAKRVYLVLDWLDELFGVEAVIHGNATGADTLAQEWCIKNDVVDYPFPPNWREYGTPAGPIRNKKMLIEGLPHVVIAFPGGIGTANMIKQAKEAGVPVGEIRDGQKDKK